MQIFIVEMSKLALFSLKSFCAVECLPEWDLCAAGCLSDDANLFWTVTDLDMDWV